MSYKYVCRKCGAGSETHAEYRGDTINSLGVCSVCGCSILKLLRDKPQYKESGGWGWFFVAFVILLIRWLTGSGVIDPWEEQPSQDMYGLFIFLMLIMGKLERISNGFKELTK